MDWADGSTVPQQSQGLFPSADEYGYLPECAPGEAAQ